MVHFQIYLDVLKMGQIYLLTPVQVSCLHPCTPAHTVTLSTMDVVKIGEYDKMSPLLPIPLNPFEKLLKYKNNPQIKLQGEKEEKKPRMKIIIMSDGER